MRVMDERHSSAKMAAARPARARLQGAQFDRIDAHKRPSKPGRLRRHYPPAAAAPYRRHRPGDSKAALRQSLAGGSECSSAGLESLQGRATPAHTIWDRAGWRASAAGIRRRRPTRRAHGRTPVPARSRARQACSRKFRLGLRVHQGGGRPGAAGSDTAGACGSGEGAAATRASRHFGAWATPCARWQQTGCLNNHSGPAPPCWGLRSSHAARRPRARTRALVRPLRRGRRCRLAGLVAGGQLRRRRLSGGVQAGRVCSRHLRRRLGRSHVVGKDAGGPAVPGQ